VRLSTDSLGPCDCSRHEAGDTCCKCGVALCDLCEYEGAIVCLDCEAVMRGE